MGGLEAQRLDPDTAAAAAADVCLAPMDVATYASDLGRWRSGLLSPLQFPGQPMLSSRLCSRDYGKRAGVKDLRLSSRNERCWF